MPRTKISEFSATPANNTDIDSINIAEGCAPSGINDAIRELMAQLKDFQTGAVGDSFNGPIGTSTAAAGAFTTLSASSTATLSGLTASTALALDASKNIVSVTNTGTGSNVLATSPTLVTPILGTPTSATLTNATGLPIATGVSGLGTGIATALAVNTGSAGAPVLFNGALGTPSSGTATNLTGLPLTTGVTGTLPTANGGTNLTSFTANGVVYASSSSALATGSALTFDGTALVSGTSIRANSFMEIRSNTAIMYWENAANTLWWAQKLTGSDFAWDYYDGSTVAEKMRLTSTGLGIGTSSPAAKLQINQVTSSGTAMGIVASSANTGLTDDFASLFLQNTNTTNGNYNVLGFVNDQGGYSSAIYGVYTSHTSGSQSGALVFSTRNAGSFAERMRLDSAGNLGLGVTPSAWRSNTPAFQIGSAGVCLFADSGVTAEVGNNVFLNSSSQYIYLRTDAASRYRQYQGVHSWLTAASGTAGNAISFSTAMTLDASGNLLLNETSQAYGSKFTLSYDPASYNGPIVLDSRSYAINRGGATWYGGKYNTAGNYRPYGGIGAKKENATDGNSAGYLAFYTNDNSADATERARIDSSGNLLVGTTSLNPSGAGTDGRVVISSANGGQSALTCYNAGTGAVNIVSLENGNGQVGRIQISGTSTSYLTSSDYRLKENIKSMTGALAKISQLKPVTYKWKVDGSDGQGFIAHELAQIVPECVGGEKDAVDANGNPQYQGIDTSFLVATLTAAIQEQQAIIESLKARLDAANL